MVDLSDMHYFVLSYVNQVFGANKRHFVRDALPAKERIVKRLDERQSDQKRVEEDGGAEEPNNKPGFGDSGSWGSSCGSALHLLDLS